MRWRRRSGRDLAQNFCYFNGPERHRLSRAAVGRRGAADRRTADFAAASEADDRAGRSKNRRAEVSLDRAGAQFRSGRLGCGSRITAPAVYPRFGGGDVGAVYRSQPGAFVGGADARAALERPGDGLDAPGRGDVGAISVCPAPKLCRHSCGDVFAAVDPHGLDHGRGSIGGSRGRRRAAHRRGRTRPARESGLPRGDGWKTEIFPGLVLKIFWNMSKHVSILALALLLAPAITSADEPTAPASPAFTDVPELTEGFRFLYEQKFPEGREKLSAWSAQNPDNPFGYAAQAASYLFEEFYRQNVLTSDFYLNEKKFLHGIAGKPDA